MEFKSCGHYGKAIEQGHCPFDKICVEQCYFSLVHLSNAYEELHDEYESIRDELMYSVDNSNELEELTEKVYELECDNNSMIEYIKSIIKRLSKYEQLQMEHPFYNWEYNIQDYINEELNNGNKDCM